MAKPKYQVVSDVVRDGLGLELLDQSDNVVAEVFRCGADKTSSSSRYELATNRGKMSRERPDWVGIRKGVVRDD